MSTGYYPSLFALQSTANVSNLVQKRFTPSDKWSVEGNRMKGTSAEARATNSYLDTLKSKVYDYQQQLIREDEEVNTENMRNKILGIENEAT